MVLYTMDERSFVGIDAIDEAHQKIAELSQALVGLINDDASFEDIRDTFRELAKVMRAHFIAEEKLMDTMTKSAEVVDHISRHKRNHKFFRDTLTYAEDMFAQKADTKEIPNVVALIPDKYIEELKNADAEMAQLLVKYGPDSGTS